MASLLEFFIDQKRRGEASDINDAMNRGEIDPQTALKKLSQIGGDPEASKAAAGIAQLQSVIPNLDMNNPIAAQKQLVQGGLAPPEALMNIAQNPMFFGTAGSPSQPSALSQVGGVLPPLPWQQPQTPETSPPPVATQPTAPQSPATPTTQTGLNTTYLNTFVPPFYRNQVMDVIQGGELAKDVSPKDRTLIMNWAHNVDPTFTETKGTLRNKMANDIASNAAGSQGGQAVQINSVLGHLYDLHEAAPDLNNTSSPADNTVANYLTEGIGGSPFHANALQGISRYNEILNRASPELNKFYVGGEGDKKGRALGTEAFASNLPLPILQDNVKTQVGMLHSKIKSLQDRRDEIMGTASSPVITPTAQALMDDINGKPLSPEQQTLVNVHRAESNLPPKTWAKSAASGTPSHPHLNTLADQTPPSAPATPKPEATKTLAGKNYVKLNGKWFEQ